MAVASLPRASIIYPPLRPLPEGEWPAQGDWTYDDYLRLPDTPGTLFAVLFGVLYMRNAPGFSQQLAVVRLDRRVGTFVDDHHLGTFMVAPFEVRLSGVAAPCQPDALFVRSERRGIVKEDLVDGAPDLVVDARWPSSESPSRRPAGTRSAPALIACPAPPPFSLGPRSTGRPVRPRVTAGPAGVPQAPGNPLLPQRLRCRLAHRTRPYVCYFVGPPRHPLRSPALQ